jgi:hypothetical protein
MQVLRNQYSHNKAPQPESQGAVDSLESVLSPLFNLAVI